MDIRLINPENAELLSKVKYYNRHFNKRRLYFVFDDPQLERIVTLNTCLLGSHGIPPKHLLFYMLVGYDTVFEQDMRRFKVLDALHALPFVMLYHKHDPKLNRFARWVNRRYYKVVPFEKFRGRRLLETETK